MKINFKGKQLSLGAKIPGSAIAVAALFAKATVSPELDIDAAIKVAAFGVLKSKLMQSIEVNEAQSRQIENCATKDELAAAIKRSDEMLEMMRRRVEEDRAAGEGNYKELYGILNKHAERITALETSQKSIFKSLEEIKDNIKTGFSEIKAELKEKGKRG